MKKITCRAWYCWNKNPLISNYAIYKLFFLFIHFWTKMFKIRKKKIIHSIKEKPLKVLLVLFKFAFFSLFLSSSWSSSQSSREAALLFFFSLNEQKHLTMFDSKTMRHFVAFREALTAFPPKPNGKKMFWKKNAKKTTHARWKGTFI